MSEINKVTVTFDDGNYKMVTTLELIGDELSVKITPDENIPQDYESPMFGLHEKFLNSFLNK